ncbi:uncharacterized protein I303_102416 [Kwoniella dejecticola CBS 10117]|uniref:Uncharacterized protein n=1 Tax=Kwoniella dejecticola CBS 10117 TaxID=1296121 RepID=A0A1A6A8N9_9TREE|nr:uncharacterized protein I303_02431 [Kwoniella dejecticola CBS 10117]OBR86424.1 hypothetical protein I303_02431 [Kwoniella dejecticola CBS 10117]
MSELGTWDAYRLATRAVTVLSNSTKGNLSASYYLEALQRHIDDILNPGPKAAAFFPNTHADPSRDANSGTLHLQALSAERRALDDLSETLDSRIEAETIRLFGADQLREATPSGDDDEEESFVLLGGDDASSETLVRPGLDLKTKLRDAASTLVQWTIAQQGNFGGPTTIEFDGTNDTRKTGLYAISTNPVTKRNSTQIFFEDGPTWHLETKNTYGG